MAVFPYDMMPDNSEELLAGRDPNYDRFGIGCINAFDADAHWYLKFVVPAKLPTGTPYLYGRGIANAATGTVNIEVGSAIVDNSTNLDTLTYTNEGALDFDFATGGGDQMEWDSVALDAASLVGKEGDELWIDLTFDESESTLAADFYGQFFIDWEEAP